MGYTNSPLVSYTKLSPNNSGQRTHAIDTISPHCVVGQATVEGLGNVFAPKSRQASCQYGIGSDGRIGMYCEEKNRSWCTSSEDNDQRAVTIECASDSKPPYAFKDIVYERLIDLCVDICQRNGKNTLIWFGDKNKTLSYNPKPNEMLLTVHRWFAKKSCPGDWMFARMGDLANKVTVRLNGSVTQVQQPQKQQTTQTSTQTTVSNGFPNPPFTVDVLVNDLPYRITPTASVVKGYTGKGKFTITEVQGVFGKLKSGVGWIDLKNSSKVKISSINNVTSGSSNTFSPYRIKVEISNLNIRKGPGTNYSIVKACPPNTYTIIAESNGKGASKWGKLDSNLGWISLDYVRKV